MCGNTMPAGRSVFIQFAFILPDNPKRLAPLEILHNFRSKISDQSSRSLRTEDRKNETF